MKTLKLLGIVLLSALFVIGMTACPEDPVEAEEELDALNGYVTIQESDYGPYTGKELKAVYHGSETVTYQWYKGEDPITGETKTTFTPTAAGTYGIEVSAEGYEWRRDSIVIKPAPGYIDFFGTWKTAEPFHPSDVSDTTLNLAVHEFLIISDTGFRLDSTWPGKKFYGATKETATKDDLEADFEYLDFTITKWDELKDADLTVSGTTFKSGFKLTVDKAKTKTKGYTLADYSAFNLYMNEPEDGSLVISIRRSGETGTGTTVTLNARTYNRQ